MTKQYAEPASYEAKLEKVMKRLGVEKYNYDWSRFACWIEFWVNDQFYRFEHSVENAKKHGQKIRYGSDVFAQVVLTLEDIARMTERGIYELQTWIAGLKCLPPAANVPTCFYLLGVDSSSTEEEIKAKYKELCKKHHPDVGGSEEMFRMITEAKNEALEMLNNGSGNG